VIRTDGRLNIFHVEQFPTMFHELEKGRIRTYGKSQFLSVASLTLRSPFMRSDREKKLINVLYYSVYAATRIKSMMKEKRYRKFNYFSVRTDRINA
jgi:hypothetical protein